MLLATGISIFIGWIAWPWWLFFVGVGSALLILGIASHVAFGNSLSLQTLGSLNPVLPVGGTKDRLLGPVQIATTPQPVDTSERSRALREILEEEYELKKLEPSLVDFGSEHITAHNDESGVIVHGQSSSQDSFPVLVRSFGNQHPRDRVKSLKRVSFRLNFICLDRATRNQGKIINIDRGAWLNEASVEVEFPSHCPRRRAVVATVEDDNRVYTIRRDSDSSYKGILPLREELTGGIYTLFLTLLVESKNAKSSQFILEIIREPSVDLRLTDAVTWKSRHLRSFIEEGHDFLDKLHEIWKDARAQVPMPDIPDPSPDALLSTAWNRRLEGSETASSSISDLLARISTIEREQEEQILNSIKDWESRATDWLDQFIGAEARDKVAQIGPSFEMGLNRTRKSAMQLMGPPTRSGKEPPTPPPAPPLPYWTLRDAVRSRVEALTGIKERLR